MSNEKMPNEMREGLRETLLKNQKLLSELNDESAKEQKALMEAEGLAVGAEWEDVPPEEQEELVPSELEPIQVRSVVESILLAADKPVNMSLMREVFRGTNASNEQIRKCLSELAVDYAGAERGMELIEVGGGYQLRTKADNMAFVRRMAKGRPFRLSGPALEVLSILAYKQPVTKHEVDQIRGVESGHLVRSLMDRGLVRFVGKSELPGKPMLY